MHSNYVAFLCPSTSLAMNCCSLHYSEVDSTFNEFNLKHIIGILCERPLEEISNEH